MERAIDAANWHDQIQSSPLDKIRWAASELADHPHVTLKIGRGALALLVNHRETVVTHFGFQALEAGALVRPGVGCGIGGHGGRIHHRAASKRYSCRNRRFRFYSHDILSMEGK